MWFQLFVPGGPATIVLSSFSWSRGRPRQVAARGGWPRCGGSGSSASGAREEGAQWRERAMWSVCSHFPWGACLHPAVSPPWRSLESRPGNVHALQHGGAPHDRGGGPDQDSDRRCLTTPPCLALTPDQQGKRQRPRRTPEGGQGLDGRVKAQRDSRPARKPSAGHTHIQTWTTSSWGDRRSPEPRCSSLIGAGRLHARRHTQLGPELCPTNTAPRPAGKAVLGTGRSSPAGASVCARDPEEHGAGGQGGGILAQKPPERLM